MKQLIKISFFLFLFQLGSFYFYGKKSISVCYYEHFNPLIYDINSLQIVSEKELNGFEKEDIKEILGNRYQIVGFSKATLGVDQFLTEENVAVLGFTVDFIFPFRVSINESLRTNTYVEIWESELVWFLGKWILRKRISTGQS